MTRWISALPIAALLVGGCAHQQEVKKDQPAVANSSGAATPATPTPAGTRSCTTDLDCGAKQLCIRRQCVDVTADLAECSMLRVHFAFNSVEIDPSDKSALERSARCLKADHALHVTIEGNADERGHRRIQPGARRSPCLRGRQMDRVAGRIGEPAQDGQLRQGESAVHRARRGMLGEEPPRRRQGEPERFDSQVGALTVHARRTGRQAHRSQ